MGFRFGSAQRPEQSPPTSHGFGSKPTTTNGFSNGFGSAFNTSARPAVANSSRNEGKTQGFSRNLGFGFGTSSQTASREERNKPIRETGFRNNPNRTGSKGFSQPSFGSSNRIKPTSRSQAAPTFGNPQHQSGFSSKSQSAFGGSFGSSTTGFGTGKANRAMSNRLFKTASGSGTGFGSAPQPSPFSNHGTGKAAGFQSKQSTGRPFENNTRALKRDAFSKPSMGEKPAAFGNAFRAQPRQKRSLTGDKFREGFNSSRTTSTASSFGSAQFGSHHASKHFSQPAKAPAESRDLSQTGFVSNSYRQRSAAEAYPVDTSTPSFGETNDTGKLFVRTKLGFSNQSLLSTYFSNFGPVVSVVCKPHKGVAFVEMQTSESARAAVETPDHSIQGLRLTVRWNRAYGGPSAARTTQFDNSFSQADSPGFQGGDSGVFDEGGGKAFDSTRKEKGADMTWVRPDLQTSPVQPGLPRSSQSEVNANKKKQQLADLRRRIMAKESKEQERRLQARLSQMKNRINANKSFPAKASSPEPSTDDSTSDDRFVVGTCTKLCPVEETQKRYHENGIHLLERKRDDVAPFNELDEEDLTIKSFTRSSAGLVINKPHLVRTEQTLLRTLDYLWDTILDIDELGIDERLTTVFTFGFVNDRTRSIRKDFSLQGFLEDDGPMSELCVRAFEETARFHILADFLLCEKGKSEGHDETLNKQEANNCLKALNQLYSKAQRADRPMTLPSEAELRTYYLLMQFQSNDFLSVTGYFQELKSIDASRDESLLDSRDMRLVATVLKAIRRRDYVSFFSFIRDENTDYVTACLLHGSFTELWFQALVHLNSTISKAKPKLFPLAELVELLCFEDEDHCAEFCTHVGFEVSESLKGPAVVFGVKEPSKPEGSFPRRICSIIEEKRLSLDSKKDIVKGVGRKKGLPRKRTIRASLKKPKRELAMRVMTTAPKKAKSVPPTETFLPSGSTLPRQSFAQPQRVDPAPLSKIPVAKPSLGAQQVLQRSQQEQQIALSPHKQSVFGKTSRELPAKATSFASSALKRVRSEPLAKGFAEDNVGEKRLSMNPTPKFPASSKAELQPAPFAKVEPSIPAPARGSIFPSSFSSVSPPIVKPEKAVIEKPVVMKTVVVDRNRSLQRRVTSLEVNAAFHLRVGGNQVSGKPRAYAEGLARLAAIQSDLRLRQAFLRWKTTISRLRLVATLTQCLERKQDLSQPPAVSVSPFRPLSVRRMTDSQGFSNPSDANELFGDAIYKRLLKENLWTSIQTIQDSTLVWLGGLGSSQQYLHQVIHRFLSPEQELAPQGSKQTIFKRHSGRKSIRLQHYEVGTQADKSVEVNGLFLTYAVGENEPERWCQQVSKFVQRMHSRNFPIFTLVVPSDRSGGGAYDLERLGDLKAVLSDLLCAELEIDSQLVSVSLLVDASHFPFIFSSLPSSSAVDDVLAYVGSPEAPEVIRELTQAMLSQEAFRQEFARRLVHSYSKSQAQAILSRPYLLNLQVLNKEVKLWVWRYLVSFLARYFNKSVDEVKQVLHRSLLLSCSVGYYAGRGEEVTYGDGHLKASLGHILLRGLTFLMENSSASRLEQYSLKTYLETHVETIQYPVARSATTALLPEDEKEEPCLSWLLAVAECDDYISRRNLALGRLLGRLRLAQRCSAAALKTLENQMLPPLLPADNDPFLGSSAMFQTPKAEDEMVHQIVHDLLERLKEQRKLSSGEFYAVKTQVSRWMSLVEQDEGCYSSWHHFFQHFVTQLVQHLASSAGADLLVEDFSFTSVEAKSWKQASFQSCEVETVHNRVEDIMGFIRKLRQSRLIKRKRKASSLIELLQRVDEELGRELAEDRIILQKYAV